jgi:hypothetical protein
VVKSRIVDPSVSQGIQRNSALGASEQAVPRIYYVQPRSFGALQGWNDHLRRAGGMGFSHVCLAPIFASASNGDVFLTDDFERPDPALQATGDADATAQELAVIAREGGLSLLLDIVLDRVAVDGAMARSAPHWFYRAGSADIVDPRRPSSASRPCRRVSRTLSVRRSSAHGGSIASSASRKPAPPDFDCSASRTYRRALPKR